MFGRKQLLFAVVGAIGFLGWVAPNQARASCGDYVMPSGQGQHTGTPPPSSQPEQPVPVKRTPGKPCHGPHCSQHQDLPPAPPAPPAPTTQKLFVSSLDLIQLDDGQARFLREESRGRLPQGAALDIFHPPRSL